MNLRRQTGVFRPTTFPDCDCSHAQPKKSAAPTFRRMLASHRRALARATELGEPPGQIAARQLEIERIEHALRRADELDHDVAAATAAEAHGGRRGHPLTVVARTP